MKADVEMRVGIELDPLHVVPRAELVEDLADPRRQGLGAGDPDSADESELSLLESDHLDAEVDVAVLDRGLDDVVDLLESRVNDVRVHVVVERAC